jgi:hypothetical protein
MIKETVLGIIRHLLTFGGGFISAEGLATAEETNIAVGAAMTLVGFAASVIQKKLAANK